MGYDGGITGHVPMHIVSEYMRVYTCTYIYIYILHMYVYIYIYSTIDNGDLTLGKCSPWANVGERWRPWFPCVDVPNGL